MLSHNLLLLLPACLGAGSMLVLAIVASYGSTRPAARAFTVYCLAVFVWCFGAAAEQLAPSLAGRIFWAQLEHVGIASLGLAWFAFCGIYTSSLRRPLWHFWPLMFIPLISLALVMTNEQHGLIWSRVGWDADFSHGWWFSFICLPYTYLLIGLGSCCLLKRYPDTSVSYRRSLLYLLLGSLVPLTPNVLYVVGFTSLPVDLTPLGFALSGILIAWTMARHRFLQRQPLPLHLLLQRLPDATLLLDLKGQVLEANLAAKAVFGRGVEGLSLAQLDPELARLEDGGAQSPYDRGGLRYQVQLEPLGVAGEPQVARLLSLRDISVYLDTAERLEQHSSFQEALLECVRSLLDADAGPEVYQLVLEQALQVIPGAEVGSVVLQQPDGLFAFVASVGFDLNILSQVRLEQRELFYGDSLFAKPTQTTELESFNRQTLAPEKLALIKQAGFGKHYKASLGVPVFLEGELLAVFSLDNATDPDAFGPTTRRLAEVFAKHIGAALQKARFKGKLERAVSAQTLLAQVERLLLETPALRDFFPLLAEMLIETEGLVLDQLVVYEYQGDSVKPHVYNGDKQREWQLEADIRTSGLAEIIAKEGNKLAVRFINERIPSYVADTYQEASWIRFAANPARTVLFCPVFRRGELWGILEFSAHLPHAFDTDTRELLISISQSTELALARESDRNKLELELLRMNTVVSTAETMRTLSTRQQIFDEAVAAVSRRTQAHRGGLFWHSADKDCLALEAVSHFGADVPEVAPGHHLPRGVGLGWQVMARDTTVYIDDVQELERLQAYEEAVRPRAYIGTPLRDSQDRPFGVLVAFKMGECLAFEAGDVAFLEAIAQATSAAIIRLELLEQAEARASAYQELYRTAERQHQELALLDRVRTALARELDLDRVARTLVTAIAETLGYTAVSLYWLEGEAFVLREQAGPNLVEDASVHVLLGRAVNEGQPVLEALGEHVWELAVPLYGHETVVGVLKVRGRTGLEFVETDRKLLGALGEQVSIALERALLHSYVESSEERFRLLAENMSDLVGLHGSDGNLRYISPSSQAVLGIAPEALVDTSLAPLVHPDDLPGLLERFSQGFRAEVAPLLFRLRRHDGEYRWFESVTHPLHDASGALQGFTSASRDVTERQAMEERLRYGAHFDSLTRLPNRVLFLERLESALETANPEFRTAVLFIDLDRFKMVNDSLGHQAGDALLRQLSARLLENVRPGDTVARLSGDEFCVLLKGITGEGVALQVVARLQQEIGKPFDIEGRECFVSSSIGVAFASAQQRAEDLLRNADIAMYRAKHGGRDTYVVFDESMHEGMVSRLLLESELRHALEHGELTLHYQPIFNLQTGTLTGFEALSRWSLAGTVIAPEVFISLAEETGLITKLDTWAVREACRQLVAWQQTFGLPPSVSVSVNLASSSFEQADLLKTLRQTLYETGLAASCLTLELTERTVMKDSAEGVSALQALRQLGIRVQVDDFGTGYSSLRYLHTLPLDSLKIDRSFIAQLTSGHSEAVVRSILALAKALGLQVVAEGIETSEQLRDLKALECNYGQGYLLSRPLSPERLEESLLAHRAWTRHEQGLSVALPPSLSN